jgi:type I restriction enzyme M protein
LIEKQITLKNKLKSAQNDLEAKVESKYSKLTEEEIKNLVVDNKWFGFLTNIIQGEIDRVSQTLTIRIRELAERYESSLPMINKKISKISDQVNEHLKKMGFTWN